jgi:hypothetical protein
MLGRSFRAVVDELQRENSRKNPEELLEPLAKYSKKSRVFIQTS